MNRISSLIYQDLSIEIKMTCSQCWIVSFSNQCFIYIHLKRQKLQLKKKFCFSSVATWLNHRDLREIIDIGNISTTKRYGDDEQEEIEQISRHTIFNVSQRKWPIRI